jgi:hypothetical protein
MNISLITSIFSPFGFVIQDSSPKVVKLFAEGKDFGIYLLITPSDFSVETVTHHLSTHIFLWQGYHGNYHHIASLIIDNNILSEQLCEKAGLATPS